jgi:hypothetical protein
MDLNPRARKRRRADSRASDNSISSIQAADHHELQDLYSHNGLPYSSQPQVPQLEVATNTSLAPHHVPNASQAMEPVEMGGMYAFGQQRAQHDKLPVQVQRSQSPVKYEADMGYGPYHAQYWSYLQGDLNAGTPLSANGGYKSPYASLASEPYYPAVQDSQLGMSGELHQNGYSNDAGDGIFPSSRQAQYHSMAPDASNVYPSPIDNFNWQYPTVEPVPQMQSLPVLESLATQILSALWSSTVHDFSATINDPESNKGQAYAALEALFEQTKKNFSRDQLFIDINSHQFNTESAIRTIRKTNLATFVLCVFRGRDVPFLDLNEVFLDIFMPTGTRLFKTEGELFLELKTQAYIAVMLSTDLSKEDVLDQLFPRDLQLVILRRRTEPAHLAPSEQDFIGRINTRRQYLLAGSDDMAALTRLPQKYVWTDFQEEVRVCVGRALECLDAQKVSSSFFLTSKRYTIQVPPLGIATAKGKAEKMRQLHSPIPG